MHLTVPVVMPLKSLNSRYTKAKYHSELEAGMMYRHQTTGRLLCGVLMLVSIGTVQPVRSAGLQPPGVLLEPNEIGLHVPLDDDLAIHGHGTNQFLGNGFAFDGQAARTVDHPGLTRFARYQTAAQNQASPTTMPTSDDWAIEIGYKHTGAHSSANQPFFVKHFEGDHRMVALFNDGGDHWSLRAGNDTGGYDVVADSLQLGEWWNRFQFHYKAATQTIDAYLNNEQIAGDITLGHGRYDANHVQIEYTGAGTDYFSEVKIGGALPQSRSLTFGNEWVRNHPLTLQGLVLRRFALDDTRYRDAHFSNVLAWENDVGLVDKADGIQGLPWHWHTGRQTLNPALQATISDWMQNRPGGEAFLVWDEPKRPNFDETAEVSNWIKENYPEVLVYGNLSTIHSPGSNYAQEYGSLPNPPPVPYDYETFVDDYLHAVQPDILQFDIYPISDDPGQPVDDYLRDRYFRGLETIRRAGIRANLPYFVVVQSFDGGGTRLPSESEIRLQTFTALGYGFKGITYFTFDHFGAFVDGNQGGMLRALDVQETIYGTNPIYFDVKKMNPELTRLGESLKLLDSTQVRFLTGKHMDNGLEVSNEVPLDVTVWNAVVDDPFITQIDATNVGTVPDITQGDLLVSHFEPALEELDGDAFTAESYFMIVNLLRHENASAVDASQDIHVEFDFGASGVSSLQRLNRLTGQVDVVSLNHVSGSIYDYDFTLPGGTGDLFKYNTGAPFIVGLGDDRAWAVDLSGSWTQGNHWNGGGVPNGNDVDVTFGDVIGQARTVVADQPVTARSITFESTQTYAVVGTGSIELESNNVGIGIDSRLEVVAGDHQFQATVNMRNDTDVNVASGATLTFNNLLHLLGNTLTKQGSGTMVVNNARNNGSGLLQVQQGILSGVGTIGGDVDHDGGTISPGNSPSLLLTQVESSRYASPPSSLEGRMIAVSDVPEPNLTWFAGLIGLLFLSGIRKGSAVHCT